MSHHLHPEAALALAHLHSSEIRSEVRRSQRTSYLARRLRDRVGIITAAATR